eukprot:jgi/Chrzof1/9017/Cz03g33040.t1
MQVDAGNVVDISDAPAQSLELQPVQVANALPHPQHSTIPAPQAQLSQIAQQRADLREVGIPQILRPEMQHATQMQQQQQQQEQQEQQQQQQQHLPMSQHQQHSPQPGNTHIPTWLHVSLSDPHLVSPSYCLVPLGRSLTHQEQQVVLQPICAPSTRQAGLAVGPLNLVWQLLQSAKQQHNTPGPAHGAVPEKDDVGILSTVVSEASTSAAASQAPTPAAAPATRQTMPAPTSAAIPLTSPQTHWQFGNAQHARNTLKAGLIAPSRCSVIDVPNVGKCVFGCSLTVDQMGPQYQAAVANSMQSIPLRQHDRPATAVPASMHSSSLTYGPPSSSQHLPSTSLTATDQLPKVWVHVRRQHSADKNEPAVPLVVELQGVRVAVHEPRQMFPGNVLTVQGMRFKLLTVGGLRSAIEWMDAGWREMQHQD